MHRDRMTWVTGIVVGIGIALTSRAAEADLEKTLRKECAQLSSDSLEARTQAAAALRKTLQDLARQPDEGALRAALRILQETARGSRDPEAEKRWAELADPYRAGAPLWDGEALKLPGEPLKFQVVDSPAGKQLIVGGKGWLGCYDPDTRGKLWEHGDIPGEASLWQVQDGRILAGGENGFSVYDVRSGKTLSPASGWKFPGKVSGFISQGDRVIAWGGGADGIPWLALYRLQAEKPVWARKSRDDFPAGLPWKKDAPQQQGAFIEGKHQRVLFIVTSGMNTGEEASWAGCYDLETGKPVWERKAGDTFPWIGHAAFDPTGKAVLMSSGKQFLQGGGILENWAGVCDMETGKRLWEKELERPIPLCISGSSAANDPGDAFLSAQGGKLGWFKLSTGEPLWKMEPKVPGPITFWKPVGGRIMAVGSVDDGSGALLPKGLWVGVYDEKTGAVIREWKCEETPTAAWPILDGNEIIASGGATHSNGKQLWAEGWIKVFDLETGKLLWDRDFSFLPEGWGLAGRVLVGSCLRVGRSPEGKVVHSVMGFRRRDVVEGEKGSGKETE